MNYLRVSAFSESFKNIKMKTLRELWDGLPPEKQWEEYLRVVVNLEEHVGTNLSLTKMRDLDMDKDQLILFEEALQLNDSGNQPS
tara:strand:+ start:396 stop:650 length:255 start_codon:yes stop_codon:yes gene_type:complete